jgi:Methylase involved in ubiquinone/menaquinone biosynthesis
VLTVDFARFPVSPGDRVLDLGTGGGRHAFECYRRGARVVALDLNADDLAGVASMFGAMAHVGEARPPATAVAVRADAYRLPFGDGVFDAVIAAEILEHIPDDRAAIAEAVRVLRPGGRLAVTVPRWWPERICWALSDAYHEVEGGHVRIYRGHELLERLTATGLVPVGRHHAHALHSPYWWLKCLFGVDNDQVLPVRLYHRLLVHDIMRGPWWTRWTERALNPVLGKSLVLYLIKPE